MARKVSDISISEDDRRRVFLYLMRMFEDEIKKNLHVSDNEIKTEIEGLYGIRIVINKDNFTHSEVSFLFSLACPGDYIKKRMEVKVGFLKDFKGGKDGLEIYIVPKEKLISYFAKRLSYY
jgi:hypothetical protein